MRNAAFKVTSIIALALVFSIVFSPFAFAVESTDSKYYMGETINAGKDTGDSENEKITEKDPHFGWKLGSFFVSGYTRETEDPNIPITVMRY